MSTWEERMSAKAKARQAAREAEEVERLRAAYPPVHPDETGPLTTEPHRGHYMHTNFRAHGNVAICSCGDLAGVFSVALDAADALPPPERCEICEARGIPAR